MTTHYQAHHFLREVQDKPDLFPVWSVVDMYQHGIMFKALKWEGPGREVFWPPHAIERLIERRNFDIGDDSALCYIQEKLKVFTSQPVLHTLGVGEHVVEFRPHLCSLAFIVTADSDPKVIIKTYMGGRKLGATRREKWVQNHGSVMERPERAHDLVDKTLWSDARKAEWDRLLENPPHPTNKYGVRHWILQAGHISGDATIFPKISRHILTGFNRNDFVHTVSTAYAEDMEAKSNFAVRVFDFVARKNDMASEERDNLMHELFEVYKEYPTDIQNSYKSTYKLLRRKTSHRLPTAETIQSLPPEDCTPKTRSAFSDRTKDFQRLLKQHSTKTVCAALGISRRLSNELFWNADTLSEEEWDLLVTKLSQETHPDETVQPES